MDETTAAVIAILTAEVEPGQAHAEFPHKERELRALIQQLSPAEALALRKRLVVARADDPLTAAFQRFTRDRRDRIVAFLADPARAVRPV